MNTSPAPTGLAPGERIRPSERARKTEVSIVDAIGRLVLVGMVSLTPWFFGGVEAAVQQWLFVGVIVALACWLVGQLTGRFPSAALPLAVLPLLGAAALGAVQLVPLGASASGFLSPAGAELRGALASRAASADVSLAESGCVTTPAEGTPLSLYPASTRHDLAWIVLATGFFVLGAVFFTTARSRIWLCGLVAASGAALACFGLIQRLTWNGLLYWSVPLTGGGAPFGPFVNRNNAGGYLNLCLAGAVGLVVWTVARDRSSGSISTLGAPCGNRPWLQKARQRLLRAFADLSALGIVAISCLVCIVTGILCTLSRGAWAAMVGAAVLTVVAVCCARRRTVRLAWAAAAAATALVLVHWVGMGDSLLSRSSSLLDQSTLSNSRIPHWRDGLRAAADFWRAGSGLGTYRYVYGLYQQRLDDLWHYHAENQYLEALVEGGVVGLGLIGIMIGLVGWRVWRLLRDGADASTFAFGVAGCFVLAGQAIHAFFDFGLYVPANMALFALWCGSISGGVRWPARTDEATSRPAPAGSRFLATFLATSLLAASIWGYVEIRHGAAVEAALKSTGFQPTPTAASPSAVRAAIERLSAALEHRPDDAEAQCRMAQLWIHLYRLGALETLRAETSAGADDGGLWQFTSPMALHAAAHQWAQKGRLGELERLRGEPVVRGPLMEALLHLSLARRACVLLPEVPLMLAELSVLVGDPAEDRVHLDRLRLLAPADPDLLFRCGALEWNGGRRGRALESWQRSLALSARHLDEILRFADQQRIQPHAVVRLLPGSPTLLLELARGRYRGDEHAQMRRVLVERAEDLVEQIDLPEAERCHLEGSVLALKERYPQAIGKYSRAVALRWREVGWRYELALLLRRQGMIDEAHEEASFCARMVPEKAEYRTLLEEINRTRLRTSTALK